MNSLLRSSIPMFFLSVLVAFANPSSSGGLEREFFTPEADKAALANATASEEGLPKVLILGDSISIGYFPAVKAALQGQSSVSRPNTNCGDTPRGLSGINKWLGDTKWDVIHFNWGLWDLCYRNPESKNQGNRDKVNGKLSVTPGDYEKNLNMLVDRLQKTGADLVWASTTVVPEGEDGRFVGDDVKYNAIASKIMNERGIPINDLYAASSAFPPTMFVKPGDVHFTKAGSELLAAKVAESILAVLPSNNQPNHNNP
jgi:lysophospholipase L1-like esterase